MLTGYSYQLWNGKKVVGTCWFPRPLQGAFVVIPEESMLKVRYARKKPTEIKFPLQWRLVKQTHNSQTFELFVCVQKKSARQIEVLKKFGGY